MAFLTLNGITVPVITGGFSKSQPTLVGERARSINGNLITAIAAYKRKWSVKTNYLTQQEAEAWRSLMMLECDSVTFDFNLYSAKGLAPSGATATIVTSAPSPKYGAGSVATGASTLTYAFPSATGAWTVCVWSFQSSAWHHYVRRSDGGKWVDGVRNDLATLPFTMSGSSVVLTASTGYDDLVFLPVVVPDTWPTQIFNFGASFAYPTLFATGSGMEAFLSVWPTITGQDFTRTGGVGSGTFAEQVSFDLDEA